MKHASGSQMADKVVANGERCKKLTEVPQRYVSLRSNEILSKI